MGIPVCWQLKHLRALSLLGSVQSRDRWPKEERLRCLQSADFWGYARLLTAFAAVVALSTATAAAAAGAAAAFGAVTADVAALSASVALKHASIIVLTVTNVFR